MHTNVIEVGAGQIESFEQPADLSVSSLQFALIIPTLHEADNMAVMLERVRKALDPLLISYEVIIVDDDSQDGTIEIVEAIAKADPRIRLITRKHERGLAGAITHGWRNTDAIIVGAIDADLQHPPEILPLMLQELMVGSDIVVASRYANGGSLNDWNRYRHFFSWLAICLTLPLQKSGLRVSDPMSGFFMVRRNCVSGLDLQKKGFKILLEILVRGDIRTVSEVPFSFGHRKAGASKASVKVAVDYFKLLVRLYRARLGSKILRQVPARLT